MDPIFEAHFPIIRDAFARGDVEIDVAYKARPRPTGQKECEDPKEGQTDRPVDYVFGRDRLLTLNVGDNIAKIGQVLGKIHVIGDPRPGRLAVLSLEHVDEHPSVPEALDRLDQRYPEAAAAADRGKLPLATPDHLVDLAMLCAPTEPEVPSGRAPGPWPRPCRRSRRPWRGHDDKRTAKVLVADTGFLRGADRHPWLRGVRGDTDELGQRPGRPALIWPYTGHGTFVAGVTRCIAPHAEVFVTNHLPVAGAELESRIAGKLDLLIEEKKPDIINLSAGSRHRKDWSSLGFADLHGRHPDVALIAAAGNEGESRPFYPAAEKWAIAVGSIGPDQQHRAWFSNHGPWVNVYTLGEGLVNAFATGEYVYIVLPRRGAIQDFTGLARWSGTSFSTPIVAGLIAAEMRMTGSDANAAAHAVLGRAQNLAGVGPVLRVS
jgi:subtilisin family serine protease